MSMRNFLQKEGWTRSNQTRSPSFKADKPEPPSANGLFCMAPSIGAISSPVNPLCCLKAQFVRVHGLPWAHLRSS